MKKLYTLLLCASFAALNAQTTKSTQPEAPDTFNYYKFPALTFGAGVTGFFGDYNNPDIWQFGTHRLSLNAGIEQRLGKTFGLSANFMWGQVSVNERAINMPRNFGSTMMNGDIRVNIYWDNDWLLRKKSKFAPYMFGGVGFATYDPKTDIKDKDGKDYYYWTDGTVRDQQQTQLNLGTAQTIRRDYKYETAIDSPGYKKNSITIPVGLGLRYKLSGFIDAYVQGTYFFTLTDDMDAVRSGDNNDAFANLICGFQIRLGKKPEDPREAKYKDVDFKAMEKIDSDGDGVRDANDDCPSTPAGVKVNGRGCPDPTDTDKDGVPDYADKELATPAGSVVDATGKKVEDTKLQRMADDTIAVPRDALKNFPASLPEPVKVKPGADKSSIDMNPVTAPALVTLPAKYKAADYNNDGKLDTKEVARVIDDFFEGKTSFDVDSIYELIDFYFDNY
jgi:hypothetical protein